MQRVAGPAAKFCAGSSTKGLSLASACQIAPPGSETETRCRGCKGIKLRKVRGPQARGKAADTGCARVPAFGGRPAAPKPAPCTDQKRSSPARLPGPGNKTSFIQPHSGWRFAGPGSPACSGDKCRPRRRNTPPAPPWPQVRHGRPRSPFR